MEPLPQKADLDDGTMDSAIRDYFRERGQTASTTKVESLRPEVRMKIRQLSEGGISPVGNLAVNEALNHLLSLNMSTDQNVGNRRREPSHRANIDDDIGNRWQ